MANSPTLLFASAPSVIDITDPASWPEGFVDPSSTFADPANPTQAELSAAIADFAAANAGSAVIFTDNKGATIGQFDGAQATENKSHYVNRYAVDPGNMPGVVTLPDDDEDLTWVTQWYEATVPLANRAQGDIVERWDGVYVMAEGGPRKIQDATNVKIDREELLAYLEEVVEEHEQEWLDETFDPDAGDPAKLYDHQYVIDGYNAFPGHGSSSRETEFRWP